MAACPECGSDDLFKVEDMADGRRLIGCENGHRFHLGNARRAPQPAFDSFAEAKKRFPSSADVDRARYARVETLKQDFLADNPAPQPEVAPYWAKYQRVFSAEGLPGCDPQDLKDFANSGVGAHPGNQSIFNRAWNDMGEAAGAARTRGAIEYLLRGPDHITLEDRLTDLIAPQSDLGMPGFKEALLTRTLCVVYPQRFVPILIYSSTAGGKREIAELVYGLELPEAAQVSWTIGRLIIWSNDVLRELAGDGFQHQQHVAQFLWITKDRTAELARA